MTGGGLIQRETPYLALAAGDPDWIAAERAVIEQFAADNDQRARCFMSLADAVLALLGGDTNAAERHWHGLLAVSSKHGFGLLWVDALEGLAICAARAGATDEAERLAGAAQSAGRTGATGTGTLTLASCRRDLTRAGHFRWRKRRRTHAGRAGNGFGRPRVGPL